MKKINHEKLYYFISALLILSIVTPLIKGPWYGVDTPQYIQMYAYLPPLYPLFLAGLRFVFGDVAFAYAAIVVQTIFAAWIVVNLLELLCGLFETKRFTKNITFILLLLTYFKVDEYNPNCNLWILTEGLSYSLFYVFVYYSIKYLKENSYSTFIKLVISVALSILCRTQFVVCIGMLVLYFGYQFINKRINLKKAFCLGMIVLLGLACVSIVQAGYKQIANRANVKMFHLASLGTHLFYYSEYEDIDKIEDESEKQLFGQIYKEISDNGWGYEERKWLDGIKCYRDSFPDIYLLISSEINTYVRQTGIENAAEVDEISSQVLNRQIVALGSHFWQWTWDALKQFPASLARTIALFYEPLQIYCIAYVVIMYGLYIYVNIVLLIQARKITNENWLCFFQMAFTFATAIVTEMSIRSIMRYLAYTFGLFYISGWLVLTALYRRKLEE